MTDEAIQENLETDEYTVIYLEERELAAQVKGFLAAFSGPLSLTYIREGKEEDDT